MRDSNYNGWLVSDSFFKRTMAVTGYGLLGSLIIYLIILVIAVFVGIGAGLAS